MSTAEKTKEQKVVSMKEMIIFFMGTFFYTNMTGMLGSYRQAYLVNVLQVSSDKVAFINSFCGIAGFALSFFLTMIIDRAPKPGHSKFKPLVLTWAIPTGITMVLLFYTPSFISTTSAMIVVYLIAMQMIYNIASGFTGQINSIAVVMSPNSSERDTILTWRGIVNAIGNSAPLVVVLVAGLITKNESLQYLGSAILCAIVAVVFLLLSGKTVKERIAYSSKKVNPILGYADILKNKYAWVVIISEFLKSFRGVATYMGVFLAAALLGSTSKYILLGLPTGVGTFIGMLIVKAFLKKFNSKQIYIASGVYSLVVNGLAFAVGVTYFKTGSSVWQIVFILTLFLIGLQFGASNLLPDMFKADILEDLEVKTHKRLDASIGFVCSIGSTVSGAIAGAVAPIVLYGSHSIIQYIQPIDGVTQEQSLKTKILLLFFYTIVHGIMMLLAGVPFFFYKLTGKTKEEVHEAALSFRAEVASQQQSMGQNAAVVNGEDANDQ